MDEQEIRNKLSAYSVGIAGCGGLGSNCAVALARVGIGRLVIVDFDVVDQSNLNRQYYFRNQTGESKVDALCYNISMIDPLVRVEKHKTFVTSANIQDLFGGCDVVVEAFDRADQKMMLIETIQELMPEKPLVSGSGMSGWGMNESIITVRNGSLYVCGDQRTEVSENSPPLAPRVGIVASMQANLVLEILLKNNLK